jgi:hypothetical protein
MKTNSEDKKKSSSDQLNNSCVVSTIAVAITFVVLLLTAFIAVYLVLCPKNMDEKGFAFIGQSLLPLWGTWIGTVLAFYFSKNNFEAASKSNMDLLNRLSEKDERLVKISVKEVMIPKPQIMSFNCENGDGDKPLEEILKDEHSRYVILDSNNIAKCVIHRSIVLDFIYHPEEQEKRVKVLKDTLKDLLNSEEPKIKNTIENSIEFVPESANLLEAKNKMESVEGCSDVFVTKTGQKNEPVLGWITNTIIFKKTAI